MTTGDEKQPALSERSAGVNWREVARTTCLDVDWKPIAKTALGSAVLAGLVGGALHFLGKVIEAEMRAEAEAARDVRAPGTPEAPSQVSDTTPSSEPETTSEGDDDDDVECVDPDEARAAVLLGVAVDASEDDVRAALRARLASSRLHPDHGGDGEEAKGLIAAKNLLIERARQRR